MWDALLVWSVVALHVAVTLAPPLSAFAALRWRRLLPVHAVLMIWAVSIPILQWPCPLTNLEKAMRLEAGMPVYQTDFVSHYLLRPLGDGAGFFHALYAVPPTIAYTLLLSGARRRRLEAAAPAVNC